MMTSKIHLAAFLLVPAGLAWGQGQRPRFDAFEVATIKKTDLNQQGRFMKMDADNHYMERAYTVKGLIAAAYDLNPKTISGGPGWITEDHFDIDAKTPGAVRPTHDEQMKMLRALLTERFALKFHREDKEFSIYAIKLAKSGARLPATSDMSQPTVMGPGVVYPDRIVLPGRNASVADLASLLQRAILDRPVVDQTGLSGRYDFDLAWAPDESQFGGDVPKSSADTPAAPLFESIERQLGLKLEPTKGMVSALVIDAVARPSSN